LSTAVEADEILVMEGGRIVERGRRSSRLRRAKANEAGFSTQRRGVTHFEWV